ncbi:MAG: hypothetical protein PHV85_00320 [Desulfovibrionaceae bacterium]|nr:hypothetical protein [Desulfovibrionaceae bacterium]
MKKRRALLVLFVSALVLIPAGLGLKLYVNGLAEDAVRRACRALEPLARVEYAKVSAGLLSREVRVFGIRARTPGGASARAEELVVSGLDLDHPAPHFFSARLRGAGIEVSEANLGRAAARLKALGYDLIQADCGLDYRYDPDWKAVTLSKVSVKAKDMGELDLELRVRRLNLDEFRPEQLVGLELAGLGLSYRDQGLARGLLAGEAAQRAENRLGDYLAWAVNERNDTAARLFQGLTDFVRRPERIEARAEPVEPVPWIYLLMGRDLLDIISLLNIQVMVPDGQGPAT